MTEKAHVFVGRVLPKGVCWIQVWLNDSVVFSEKKVHLREARIQPRSSRLDVPRPRDLEVIPSLLICPFMLYMITDR